MPEKTLKAYDEATVEEGGEDLGEFLYMEYLKKRKTWPKEVADRVERSITLSVIDRNWTKHIDAMTHLREGIGLRSYAQTNPLQDYVNEGYDMFREMNQTIAVDSVFNFMNARLRTSTPEQEQPKPEPKVIEAKPEEKKAAKEEPKEIAEPKKKEVQSQPEPKPQPAPVPASDPSNAAILHVGTAAPQKFEYVARPEEDDNKPMNLDEAKQITRLMLEKKITREQVIEATQRDPMDFHLLCKDAKAIIAYLQGDNSKEMPVNPIQNPTKE